MSPKQFTGLGAIFAPRWGPGLGEDRPWGLPAARKYCLNRMGTRAFGCYSWRSGNGRAAPAFFLFGASWYSDSHCDGTRDGAGDPAGGR